MSDAGSPPAKGTSGLGIAALVIGILGLVGGLIPCLGFFVGLPLAVVGVILGLIAVIIAASGKTQGIGMPLAGLLISLVAVPMPWISTMMGLAIGVNYADTKLKEAKADFDKRMAAASEVTPDKLLKAYKDDAKKANDEYKGKFVKLSGKVEDNTGLALSFKGDADLGIVRVTPPISLDLEKFTALKKGDQVTIGGVVTDGKKGEVTITGQGLVK